jgi:hypothetical protein
VCAQLNVIQFSVLETSLPASRSSSTLLGLPAHCVTVLFAALLRTTPLNPYLVSLPAATAPSIDAYILGGVPDRPRLHSAPCTLLAWRNVTMQCVFTVVMTIARTGEPHVPVIRETTQTSGEK